MRSFSTLGFRTALLLLLCAVFLLPVASVGAQKGTGVFGGREESRFPSGGEVVTLKFEDTRYDHGQGHIVGNQFRAFLRDKNSLLDFPFDLPEVIKQKTNLEIILTVNKFDTGYFGVWLHDGDRRAAALALPLNGGKVMVRHYDLFRSNSMHSIESGYEIQAVQLPARVHVVYEALEQQCTVFLNDVEVATYCFATFENRIPWNIPRVQPFLLSGEKTPVRAELDAEFTIRAW